VTEAAARARRGEGPTLIESRTMRMRGHSEHDDFAYVPTSLMSAWTAWDPLARLRAHLVGRVSEEDLQQVEAEVQREVDEAFDAARTEPDPDPSAAGIDVFRRWEPGWTPPEGQDWELP